MQKGNADYKNKYMELRGKYLNDIDMAFRLGFEQGQQQAQTDQAMEAQQQQQQMDQLAAQGGQPGMEGQPGEGQPPGQPGEGQPGGDAMAGQPTELDQHISKLEGMIAKSESLSKDEDVKKSLKDLVTLRKAELFAIQMKKSDNAVKGIVKALHKPAFKMSRQASHNLSTSAKQAVSLQHKIVNDVMSKMEAEERRAQGDIKNILNIEGLTKKE